MAADHSILLPLRADVAFPPETAANHSILLPLRADVAFPPETWVGRLCDSFLAPSREPPCLYIGVDDDDDLWLQVHRQRALALLAEANVPVVEVRHPRHPRGTVCAICKAISLRASLSMSATLFRCEPRLTCQGEPCARSGTTSLRAPSPMGAMAS